MSAKSARVKKLALLAMFTAIGAVLITLVHFPLFPAAPFLQYDPADVPILIAAFAFGPVAGILVTSWPRLFRLSFWAAMVYTDF